jgi:hypothetical protein
MILSFQVVNFFYVFNYVCGILIFLKRNVQLKKVFGDKFRILSCSNAFKFGKIPMYWASSVWLRV